MAFLSAVEAAQLLNMPVTEMKKLEIHKCPQGYSEEILQEFCSLHGLPVGDWHNIVGFSTEDIKFEGVRVYSTWEETMFATSVKTKALLSDDGLLPETVVRIAHQNGIKIIVIAEEKGEYFTASSWQEAIEIARNL